MNNKINADALLNTLFETIEGVKNQNDPNASDNEKTTIEQAKAINELSKSAIAIYKVKLDAARLISSSESPLAMKCQIKQIGLGEE